MTPDHGSGGVPAIRRVCVYCASSTESDAEHRDAARRLGLHLAGARVEIVYGGGGKGSMGALADGALAAGGRVVGIIPRFMQDLEWSHRGLDELHVVEDMHARKQRMVDDVDGVVALPGGCGTLEELLEAITWKRLGLFFGPIVLVNVRRFYDPLVELLRRAIDERFMDPRHARMWHVVEQPDEVLDALRAAAPWPRDARSFATR
jgi:hypothetical protein